MKKTRDLKSFRGLLFITWKDALKTLVILAAATGLCVFLATLFDDNNPFAAMIYVLAVAAVSRLTEGFLCGVIAAVIGVICVNYMFTYPFYEFNLVLTGYPLTFSVMLIVSLIISTLTTMLKRQELLKREMDTEKARANLLRSVSHDLRTPLTSITGASSVLRENWEDIAPADRDELLGEIHDDARWLINMVENILSVTKCGDDGARITKSIEAVEEIIGEVVVKFKKTFPDVTLRTSIPESVLLVPMDAVLIEQVIMNLLENAVRHGNGTTEVSLSVGSDSRSAVFTVLDNGGGFSPDILNDLWGEPIKRKTVAVTAPDMRRDMGIGLSVCMTIIKAHGGVIAAKNTESGAAVSFSLPLGGEPQ
ncbi:MAG: DUF4118 domain-containing protein [Oscillospiraceae bacterium]|nr:DUF4118 domain-containing protein [Oscillospiraceae bacterium]